MNESLFETENFTVTFVADGHEEGPYVITYKNTSNVEDRTKSYASAYELTYRFEHAMDQIKDAFDELKKKNSKVVEIKRPLPRVN